MREKSIFTDMSLRMERSNPRLSHAQRSRFTVSITGILLTCGNSWWEAEEHNLGVVPKWEIEQYTELLLFPFNLPLVSLPLFS